MEMEEKKEKKCGALMHTWTEMENESRKIGNATELE